VHRHASVVPLARLGTAGNAYTYGVPPSVAGEIRPGQLVRIPFRERVVAGIVVDLQPPSDMPGLRELVSISDIDPVLAPYQLELAEWIRDEYRAPWSDVLGAMLPPVLKKPTGGSRPSKENRALVLTTAGRDAARRQERERRAPRQQAVLLHLDRAGGLLPERELAKAVGPARAAVPALLRAGLVESIAEAGRELSQPIPAPALSAAQAEAVAMILGGPRSDRDGRPSHARAEGQVADYPGSRDGDPARVTMPAAVPFPSLNGERSHSASQVYLLHGVTGSGKTEVYMAVIDEVIRRGLGAIVMVPEISLTPQALRRFTARFPGKVAATHSELSPGERRREWQRLRAGAARIAVGPRSALFAPLRGIGAIIVDEEHDGSYKQDESPRYHARDVAIKLGSMLGAPVILGSATPDVCSYYHARKGRYTLLNLPDRPVWSDHELEVQSSGLGVQSSEFGVQSSEFGAQSSELGVQSSEFRVQSSELGAQGSELPTAGESSDAASDASSPSRVIQAFGPLATQGQQFSDRANEVQSSGFKVQSSELREAAARSDAGSNPSSCPDLPPASRAMPSVEIVDLRQELKLGNRTIFSRPLLAALEETLAARHQALLFLNRRGNATSVVCRHCGYVAACKACDIPLTFHSTNPKLICHRCNRRYPGPPRCPKCGGDQIRYLGVGTQKVVEEVQRTLPAARVLRWDRDVTGKKGAHEAIAAKFERHEADVLVGTQMIAKGLDFPLVTLVGVVVADIGLNFPDFRSAERAFQLMTQVAGRAGRAELSSRVIIQSYNPEHYALQAAREHDYWAFYRQEMTFRHEARYPPYRRLVRFVLKGRDDEVVGRRAHALRNALVSAAADRGVESFQIIGPAPSFTARVDNIYQWHLLALGQEIHCLLDVVPEDVIVDVDPVDVL
jgi:primosomal protein N'